MPREETLVLLLPNILDIDIFMALASTRSVHRPRSALMALTFSSATGMRKDVESKVEATGETGKLTNPQLCHVGMAFKACSGSICDNKKVKLSMETEVIAFANLRRSCMFLPILFEPHAELRAKPATALPRAKLQSQSARLNHRITAEIRCQRGLGLGFTQLASLWTLLEGG